MFEDSKDKMEYTIVSLWFDFRVLMCEHSLRAKFQIRVPSWCLITI